jgi:hypothetical protein
MANQIPFQPMGKSVFISLTANTANTVVITSDSPCSQLLMHNGTANDVYVSFSPTSATAVAAVIPVAGTPSYGMLLKGNAVNIRTTPGIATSNTVTTLNVSLISGSAGNVYVTPGEGL